MASTAQIASLRAELTLKSKKFDKGMKRARRRTKNLTASLRKMGIVLVAAFGTAAIANFVKKSLEAADAIGKFADRAGISTDALQQMKFAFGLAGVGVEKMNNSFITFGKRLGKAQSGFGALSEGLKKGHPELLKTVLATNNVGDAMDVIFIAMGKATDQAKKLEIADAAFGGTGLKMTAAFKKGSKAFFDARIEAQHLGVVLEERLIRNAEELNDAFSRVSQVLNAQLTRAFLNIAPAISVALTLLLSFLKTFNDLIGIGRDGSFGAQIIRLEEELKPLELRLKKIKEVLNTPAKPLDGFSWLSLDFDALRTEASGIINRIRIIKRDIKQLGELRPAPIVINLKKVTNPDKTKDLSAGKKVTVLFGGDKRVLEDADRVLKIAREINDPLISIRKEVELTFKAFQDGLITFGEFAKKRAEALESVGADFGQQWPAPSADERAALDELTDSVGRINRAYLDIADPLSKFKLDLGALNILQSDGKISADQYANALGNLQLNTANFLADQTAALGFVRTFTTDAAGSYADMFGDIMDGQLTFRDAFISILTEMRNEILRLLILKPLMDALFTGAAGLFGGGIAGGVFGGAENAGGVFGGALAHGGRAVSGRSFLVGEQGPELFTPGVSGSITPNSAGGGNVFYIDARNSTGEADLERRIKKSISEATPFLTNVAVQTVRDGIRRDPQFL